MDDTIQSLPIRDENPAYLLKSTDSQVADRAKGGSHWKCYEPRPKDLSDHAPARLARDRADSEQRGRMLNFLIARNLLRWRTPPLRTQAPHLQRLDNSVRVRLGG